MITPSLAQEVSQLEAELCFALADPTRILKLYALKEGSRNVTELGNALGISQPTASRHLKILRERGLVKPERRGVVIEYSPNDHRIIQALDLLRAVLRDRLIERANPSPLVEWELEFEPKIKLELKRDKSGGGCG